MRATTWSGIATGKKNTPIVPPQRNKRKKSKVATSLSSFLKVSNNRNGERTLESRVSLSRETVPYRPHLKPVTSRLRVSPLARRDFSSDFICPLLATSVSVSHCIVRSRTMCTIPRGRGGYLSLSLSLPHLRARTTSASLGMQIALFPYVRVMGYYAHVATAKEFDDSDDRVAR